MGSIKAIFRKLKRKIALSLMNEMEQIKSTGYAKGYQVYTGFKSIGKGSYFWGKQHFISGKEFCEIGNNVHINDNAYIRAEGGLIIGDNTHISRNLLIYTINHDYNGECLPYDNKMIKKPVVIGKNVWIGMNVCITPGTSIGEGCIVGMGSVVSGNIPPLSIISSPKAVEVKKRDETHYTYLENAKRYGGINGNLINWGGDEYLAETGDVYNSARSSSKVIIRNGKKAVKKEFLQTPAGKAAFDTERNAYQIFQKYGWMPQLYEEGDYFIVTEFLEQRLDLWPHKDETLLGDILFVLFDIYNEGYAHCDFHAKNIFITSDGVKLIDFESMQQQPVLDYFDSYDITGKGLQSPYNTRSMCVMSTDAFSLSTMFRIKEIEQLKYILNQTFNAYLLDSSISFKTRRTQTERHSLQKAAIYASFNLLHTHISPSESQRNTGHRLEKFGINNTGIRNKAVLDIGSNIGATLLGLAKFEPKEMIGLEYDENKVNISNKLAAYNGIRNVRFLQADIEDQKIDKMINRKFDVVFCLAVIEHLKNKEQLFILLAQFCNGTLYFEGNANSNVKFIETSLKQVGFAKVEYLGSSDDEKNDSNNVRPLFIAVK